MLRLRLFCPVVTLALVATLHSGFPMAAPVQAPVVPFTPPTTYDTLLPPDPAPVPAPPVDPPLPALTLTLAANPSVVSVGETVVVTLTLTNAADVPDDDAAPRTRTAFVRPSHRVVCFWRAGWRASRHLRLTDRCGNLCHRQRPDQPILVGDCIALAQGILAQKPHGVDRSQLRQQQTQRSLGEQRPRLRCSCQPGTTSWISSSGVTAFNVTPGAAFILR